MKLALDIFPETLTSSVKRIIDDHDVDTVISCEDNGRAIGLAYDLNLDLVIVNKDDEKDGEYAATRAMEAILDSCDAIALFRSGETKARYSLWKELIRNTPRGVIFIDE